jgi:hypothetical protein
MLAAPLRPCKADMHVDIVEIPSIPRSVPAGASGGGGSSSRVHAMASATTRSGHPARVRWVEVFERKGGGMDSDTLEGDLDLILGPPANVEPVGEWDWEPSPGNDRPDGELGLRARGGRDGRRGRLRGVGRRGRLSFPGSRDGGGGPGRPLLRVASHPTPDPVRPAAAHAGPLRPRGPTGRARGLERRASRSRRHRWTRTRHPTSHRTTGPADRRRRGRTPGGGS